MFNQHCELLEVDLCKGSIGIKDGCQPKFTVGAVRIVGDHPPPSVADVHFADVVFDALFARLDHAKRSGRVCEIQHAGFTGQLGPGDDEHELFTSRCPDTYPETLVGLLVHQLVFARRRSKHVAPHLVGAPRFITAGVEQIVVTQPVEITRHAVNRIRQQLPGVQVFNPQVVAFVAAGVGGISHVASALGHGCPAEGEELVLFG